MHAPISASVAGIVGLSNTREARLNANGVTASNNNGPVTKPLEENTDIGDRDAQEQYQRQSDERSNHQSHLENSLEQQASPLLQLPAEDDTSQGLDIVG